MLIYYGDALDKPLSGDALLSAVLRSSLEPVPMTFEATIRLDASTAEAFTEGRQLRVGHRRTKVTIVYAQNIDTSVIQGAKLKARRIVALHSGTCAMSYRLQKAVIRENTSLSEIYAACGAKVAIKKDFTVPRFYGYQGDVPSLQIAQILQEEGGVVCWNADDDSVSFYRINDVFTRKSTIFIPVLADETQKSGFIERHEIPAYYSIRADGQVVQGDFSKPRAVAFVPHKTSQQLYAMSQVLLNVKVVPAQYAPDCAAGDVVQVMGRDFVVITAAHDSSLNANGVRLPYSMLWLGVRA
ncbi:hypothetical protein [Hydromonas duriensis]|uniref:Uncharacterized protein n=1 Tax=Hydromonas duriensis TaxID=1527608 RepID=A0A4R6Y6L1_9BURK|nr:hypothetical protein [Hydromonas duriensis]TDR30691.1 hypothetical protein DFR44_11841 [Hydromonas duriensis]